MKKTQGFCHEFVTGPRIHTWQRDHYNAPEKWVREFMQTHFGSRAAGVPVPINCGEHTRIVFDDATAQASFTARICWDRTIVVLESNNRSELPDWWTAFVNA